MTDTATVETLTAEVRTLMVGSRQITLSVAKQLDVIPLADLRVFGRVHLGERYDDCGYVIGAAPDGSLSLAGWSLEGDGPLTLDFATGQLTRPSPSEANVAAACSPLIVLAGLR